MHIILLILIGFVYLIYKSLQGTSQFISEKFNSGSKPSTNNQVHRVLANFDFPKAEPNTTPFFVFFDLETTGFSAIKDHALSISWIVFSKEGKLIKEESYYLKTTKNIPASATAVNNITIETLNSKGVEPEQIFKKLFDDMNKSRCYVAHNMEFDISFIRKYFSQYSLELPTKPARKYFCTMKETKTFMYESLGMTKYPKLSELLSAIYYGGRDIYISGIHSSIVDTRICAKCFFELKNKAQIHLPKYLSL